MFLENLGTFALSTMLDLQAFCNTTFKNYPSVLLYSADHVDFRIWGSRALVGALWRAFSHLLLCFFDELRGNKMVLVARHRLGCGRVAPLAHPLSVGIRECLDPTVLPSFHVKTQNLSTKSLYIFVLKWSRPPSDVQAILRMTKAQSEHSKVEKTHLLQSDKR